jgi:short-subunit dehydrogenase
MTVLATARRHERLVELAAGLPPGRVIPLAGDLTEPGFRAELWRQAESLPDGVDLLVNNAGIGHYAEFADQDPAAIRQIFELNVMALFDLSQRAARSMRARGYGQILQISSVLGFVGIPYSAAYVASKHAVNGLVKSLRYELRGTGVRLWAACPGRTQSEFSSRALGAGGRPVPLPRGEPTDRVVRAILRGLHGSRAFLVPSWTAWAGLRLAAWAPPVFDWLINRWARRHVGAALEASPVEGPDRLSGDGPPRTWAP